MKEMLLTLVYVCPLGYIASFSFFQFLLLAGKIRLKTAIFVLGNVYCLLSSLLFFNYSFIKTSRFVLSNVVILFIFYFWHNLCVTEVKTLFPRKCCND